MAQLDRAVRCRLDSSAWSIRRAAALHETFAGPTYSGRQSIPEQRSQLDQSGGVLDTAARAHSETCRAMLCVVQTSGSLIWSSISASPLTESTNIEFRTEIFNIFNFTNFAVPSTTSEQRLADSQFNRRCCLRPAGLQPGEWFQSVAGGRRASVSCDKQWNALSDWERTGRSSLRCGLISKVLDVQALAWMLMPINSTAGTEPL